MLPTCSMLRSLRWCNHGWIADDGGSDGRAGIGTLLPVTAAKEVFETGPASPARFAVASTFGDGGGYAK